MSPRDAGGGRPGVNSDAQGYFDPEMLRRVLAPIAGDRAFLVWAPVPRGNRTDKLPADPVSGEIPRSRNSTLERATLTLEEAIAAAELHGLGIGMAPGKASTVRVIAGDMDNVFDLDGKARPDLAAVWSEETYGEFSPSGQGLRLLMLGEFGPCDAGSGREIGSVGFYYNSRKFVTLTGRHVGGPQALVDGSGVVRRGVAHMQWTAMAQKVAGAGRTK